MEPVFMQKPGSPNDLATLGANMQQKGFHH
jgi:hypothetical protein